MSPVPPPVSGRRGGIRSRRVLAPDAARDRVRVREARRLFTAYYAQCFWSFRRDLRITLADVAWVADQMRKHGGMEEWRRAARLCR